MSTTMKQFEGRTLEEAVAAATDELGPEIQLIDARKEREGGMLGFFEKERFVLSVRPKREATVAQPAFDNVLAEVESEHDGHEELLRLAMTPAAPPPQPSPQPVVREPAAPVAVVPETVAPTGPAPAERAVLRTVEDLAPTPQVDVRRVIDLREGRTSRPPAVETLDLPAIELPSVEPQPAAVAPAEQRSGVAALVDSAAPSLDSGTEGTPGWSLVALEELGLPRPVLFALSTQEHDNDLAWAAGLEATIASFMEQLPRTPSATAIGIGIRSAVELVGGIVAGITPDHLVVGDQQVPATATELALAIRECLR